MLFFYCQEFLAPYANPLLENHPLLAVTTALKKIYEPKMEELT
jgi:hypothetical protein